MPLYRNIPLDEHRKFNVDDFYASMSYFQEGIQNPYHTTPPRNMLRFWTKTQKNYYASVLYKQNKLFPHKHIPRMDMEDISCFNNALQDLYHAKLLQFCSECIA